MPSSRKTGAAIATEPSISSPSLVAIPVMTIPPRPARSSASVGVLPVIRTMSCARTSSSTSARGEREQDPAGRPGIERRHLAGLERHAQRLVALDLVEADRGQPDPSDDDRGLAGLVGEHPQRRVRVPDQLLAADVGAGPDEQLRAETELAAVPIDEAELGEGPQVAVDGRQRHLEQRAELIGPDLAAIGDHQQEAQAARERGVLGGLFGRSIARGGGCWRSHDAGIPRASRDGSTHVTVAWDTVSVNVLDLARAPKEAIVMPDVAVFDYINALSAEKRQLFAEASDGRGLSTAASERLAEIKVELDRCYDLLHQREARRAAGLDPDEAELRPVEVVERYQQ